ncbi:hypothetical protein TCAL_10429 [Tigriopus californicus]|uniref:Nuclear pore complex protein Nup85 n=1 Tax=Tigriopus californicus TaxID=6832 RepID=A0A553P9Q8_TIGCA|nr:hypothetical protein TCAL_10429 [Tigriopus californicus]
MILPSVSGGGGSAPPPPTQVTVPQSGGALGVAWQRGNALTLFPTRFPPLDRSAGGGAAGSSGGQTQPLTLVSWERSLFEPVFRKLINESAQIFIQLQRGVAPGCRDVGRDFYLQISRQYRSVIRDCQELLDGAGADPNTMAVDGTGDTPSVAQSELLYKLELIWNLVEVLVIETRPVSKNGIILPQLVQWCCLHFPEADQKARHVLTENPEQPEMHAHFWDALLLFLIQGRTEQAQKLLRLHSDFGNTEAFGSLDELIRKMPRYSPQLMMSSVDFDFRFKHWQKEVRSRLDEGDFASSHELHRLALVLSGSEEALSEMADKCETWYQWMIGKLLFTQPDVKSYDLSYHAQQAINKFGGLSGMTSLDSILLAVMESDIAQVINELSSTLDNHWFPAHLLDLLYHTDPSAFETNPEDAIAAANACGSLREYLILEYGTCLMSHRSLWQVGALYMDHCPTQGKYRLELLLERIPLDTETKANKIMAMANERGMYSIVGSTCRVMGMQALREKRIGSAMAWALRSQDAQFTTFLADQLLLQYCEEGSFTSADLLDHLGSSMVLSDRLTFLAKYREFHRLCSEEQDFKAAASLLHSLMWSRMAPKYFWVTLLIDALPFVSCQDEVLLSSEQTYELLHCLQEISKDESLPKKQKLLLEEHEPQIRLELSRNLAIALMEEGDEQAITLAR